MEQEIDKEALSSFLKFEEVLCKRLAYVGNEIQQCDLVDYTNLSSYYYESNFTGEGDFEFDLQPDGKVFIGEGHDSDYNCTRRAMVFSQEFIHNNKALEDHIKELQNKRKAEQEARLKRKEVEKLAEEANEYKLFLELKNKFEGTIDK